MMGEERRLDRQIERAVVLREIQFELCRLAAESRAAIREARPSLGVLAFFDGSLEGQAII